MSAVKALQQWCRVQCEGYRDVSITNMTTSFRDGLAFCALIHKHRPELIDFYSLKKDDVYENNKLAFKVAEEQLGIPALLDAEDMVALKVPDRLSILTYVSQYYNYFHGRSPIGGMGGIKRPAETHEPPGKKNQPVMAKAFPAGTPARGNSPPPPANPLKPSPSPKQIRKPAQDTHVEKSAKTGTLSNKCMACDKHVHLVQRHLVDGKLYHRSCARSLPSNSISPLRELQTNTHVSKLSPQPEPRKTSPGPSVLSAPRSGPTWLKDKQSSPSNGSGALSTSSGLSSAVKETPQPYMSKTTVSSNSTFTSTISIGNKPTAAPRTSLTADKTRESKLKFLQADIQEENKTATFNTNINKGVSVPSKGQEASVGQAVTLVINVKEEDKGGVAKTTSVYSKTSTKPEQNEIKTKAAAASYISKRLAEENNKNNSAKPAWTNVALKKTEKPQPQEETPKKEPEAVKGRVKLKVNPLLLTDLKSPEPEKQLSPSQFRDRTPEKLGQKPGMVSQNISAAAENESPAEWRLKLRPVSKDTKSVGPVQSSPKPWSDRVAKPSALSVQPLSPPATKETNKSKTKPGYIPKEDIIRELREIEDNLNALEKRGVELEVKLRRSEEEGDDEALADELMVEWFTLIKNKQVAMRRESELVYIGRTQDLEEEQPSVEQELRKLMEKPEHLKTTRDREREKQLMEKLLEIVNDRNAIIDGLDEDRLREVEEDEELNKMMMNFNIKKDKSKKRFRLFSWGAKKEA